MSRNGKVIVAMSGGVDSSVAACLLQQQGYECIGVFMRVGAHASEAEEACALPAEPNRNLKHGCCSAADAIDARAIAGKLDVPFYALNFEREFDGIIDYFVDEYSQARTPNPCIMCNSRIKFGRLLQYADMMDAEFVATGHYARVLRDSGGDCRLARSLNLDKDQSYVLFGIGREHLPRFLFPVGEIADKAEVRAIASELGLRVHDKPDSQEICFVPENDYRRLLAERRPELLRPGSVVDADGKVLGQHEGVAAYTIGQRRGLGIAAGKPIYVTRLNVLNNTVTVGAKEDLLSSGLVAESVNWLRDPPAVGTWQPAQIKIRYTHTPAAGKILLRPDGAVEARFDEQQTAVTPGQAAVFYEGDVVLGGGWIGNAE